MNDEMKTTESESQYRSFKHTIVQYRDARKVPAQTSPERVTKITGLRPHDVPHLVDIRVNHISPQLELKAETASRLNS